MSTPLRFNPRLASNPELAATIVAMSELINPLIEDFRQDAIRGIARHWLLVAPSGAGKTTTTELVARQLVGWRVVRLPEEPFAIGSVGDLVAAVVSALEGEDLFGDLDAEQLEELAVDRARSLAATGPPVLVLAENLDLLLERLTDRDQKRLRQIVMRNPPFRLLATAALAPPATARHEAAFYDFFQTLFLPELTRESAWQLVETRASWDRVHLPPRAQADFRALWPWLGGNPRRLLGWYERVRLDPGAEPGVQLLGLLDAMTPHYQRRMRALSPQMARVFQALAVGERLSTPSVLGRLLRLPTNQVTANLTRLEAERLVRPGSRLDGRSRYWECTEPLFRAWLLLRDGRYPDLQAWISLRSGFPVEDGHAASASADWKAGLGAALHPEHRATFEELS